MILLLVIIRAPVAWHSQGHAAFSAATVVLGLAAIWTWDDQLAGQQTAVASAPLQSTENSASIWEGVYVGFSREAVLISFWDVLGRLKAQYV